jgi:hypothetical protein
MAAVLTDLFSSLGAPLKNKRWSWGAIRPADGNVILRIWQDQIGLIQNKIPTNALYPPKTMVCYIGCHDRHTDGGNRQGWIERQEHIGYLQDGHQGWGIMCLAVQSSSGDIRDETLERRKIKSFDDMTIWKFGEVFVANDPYDEGEDYWVTMTERPPLASMRL